MASRSGRLESSGGSLSKIKNKLKRQDLFAKRQKSKESAKRDERHQRRKAETQNPSLRAQRLKANVPLTLESKRKWDDGNGELGTGLGVSIDVTGIKRPRTDDGPARDDSEGATAQERAIIADSEKQDHGDIGDDDDSMLEFDGNEEEPEDGHQEGTAAEASSTEKPTQAQASNLVEALQEQFPTLFAPSTTKSPKILVTTSLNATIHKEAQMIEEMIPNSVYIPRSGHIHAHKFSVREIAGFATKRKFTSLVVLKEDQKRPAGMVVVHLPSGPTFHFSISNWMEGKRLPNHGASTDHDPELILNNFRTPLGLVTAHLFKSLFPPTPELRGRQVLTLHNQRDYIFVRRHRYVFREKRDTEKSVTGADGKIVKGVEDIRAGLQELGPRFTLKLRRLDTGIGRGVKNDGLHWEWKGKTDRIRTKFQL